MALLTRPRCKGWMNILLEELLILRRMWIVAVSAVHGRSLYVQVGLSETRPLWTVAFPAQGLDRLTHQGILRRRMRSVASLAVPGCGLVSLLLFHPRLHILVARQTQIRTLCQKERRQPCLVWIMARRAFRVFDGLVLAPCALCPCLEIGMTRGTEGSLGIGNHAFDIASM